MRLLELQRRMAADIMRPLTNSDSTPRKTRAEYIKANDRLTARERLEVYSRSYWYRLIDSMHEDFPGLYGLLGKRAFYRLVRAYLADCPSRSFSLRDLGSHLEAWLRRKPEYGGNNPAIAVDMVRLEWAHIEAWDARSVQPVSAEDLLALDPELRLDLQPHVQLIAVRFPVDEFRLTRCSLPQKPKRRLLAVHRVDSSVFYKVLAGEEFQLLRSIQQGQTITEAVEKVLIASSLSVEDLPLRLKEWFAVWAQLGWLVPRSVRGDRQEREQRTSYGAPEVPKHCPRRVHAVSRQALLSLRQHTIRTHVCLFELAPVIALAGKLECDT